MKDARLFLCFLLFWLGGCAYVNTLYNGNSAYRRAQRIERQDLRISRDSAITAGQTHPLYRRAIQKAEKILLEFPRSENAHDNAYFLKGVSYFAMGEFMSAINDFEILLEFFPESKFAPRTLFFIARAFANVGDFLAAEVYVNTLLEKFPNMENNRDLIMLRADLALELEGTIVAVAALEERLAQTKDPHSRMIIIERLMRLTMESGDYERALSYTEKLPVFDKKHVSVYYKIEFRKLQCLRNLFRREEAVVFADFMLRRPAYLYNRTEIMLEKAVTLIEMSRYDDAVRIFEDIIAIGGDARVRSRAWFGYAGVSIDVRGNLDSGQVQLDSALSLVGDDQEMRNLIMHRLNGLRAIAQLRADLEEADPFEPIDSAYFRFRIGEEFWLSAQLPESALVYFDALASSLQTPDSVRAKSLYSKAYILMNYRNDTAAASEIFNEIIERYPQFEAAKSAQERLGMEVTLMTRRDSANAQFAIAERIFFENNQEFSQDAYHAYLLTALRFSDIEDVAARALFAAGWIANRREIFQEDFIDTTVIKIFVRLCEDFPESEQCKEAQNMMNANEVMAFAQEYSARMSADSAQIVLPDTLHGASDSPRERRAVLPDFQSWL